MKLDPDALEAAASAMAEWETVPIAEDQRQFLLDQIITAYFTRLTERENSVRLMPRIPASSALEAARERAKRKGNSSPGLYWLCMWDAHAAEQDKESGDG